ncbi:hypothetical protein ABFS82_04G104500 [Erythranthe guttata]|uniref:Uncharacterized protein n=1 Tax=Erythranthe guttata TaxID=4155 RepID=A0A022QBM9_ERYGU|nr:PREDICTED: uncharacterized protein LOC105972375 [Erythranthe guttata]EYU24663.1 hypothetical protein MIMGU_mgv1a012714mg [Erythranthe guttata]|eukprot:XP_012852780.1 PREDICTED: uncharacterized protein LOC105972375 [Erythranthe guttata]
MPKDEIVNSASFDETTTTPCSKDLGKDDRCDISGSHVGDVTEWEEIQCPICMERPHNAVLLNCSSRDKGCRPFICDTLHPHSNCLDQFRKLSATSSSSRESEIACPLCRGAVTGFDVVGPARVFMDSQQRGCSAEGCGFAGSYRELKRHALVDHFFDGGESFSDESEVSDFDEDEEDEVVFGEASAYFFGSEYYGRNNAMSVPLRSNERRGNGSTRLRENGSSRDRGENVQYRSSSRYFIPG